MEETEIKIKGRRLLVEFTCGRCGATALVPYEHSDNFSVRSNVQTNHLPQGWRTELPGLPLLCSDCKKALQEFMNKER